MSESYTVCGDTLFPLGQHVQGGQTFRPLEEHILEWIDLELEVGMFTPLISVRVFHAGADHKPFGERLAHGMYEPPFTFPPSLKRFRFKMYPSVKLDKGAYYAIVVYHTPIFVGTRAQWQYDKDDATYPRGIRISSNDDGATWSTHFNDDHMFVEFGTPPAIKPPPEPPIINVAPVNISWRATCTGYIITVATNVPCNLKMLWTTEMPFKHMTDRYLRGIAIQPFIKYCFVVYHTNEQEEPGDTLYHTFIKDPWPICETRYFTFRGKVDDSWSPSSFPIFKLHFDIKKTAFIDTASNRTVVKYHATWPGAHDALLGDILDNYKAPYWLIFAGVSLTVRYRIFRGYLFFDTSELDPATQLAGAYLSIFVYEAKMTSSEAKPYLQITQGVQNDPIIQADYGAQLPYTTIGGQIRYDVLIPGQYNQIPLNDVGLGFINPGGITKLCLRSQQDVEDSPPPLGTNWVKFYSQQKGLAYTPRLTICHQ